MANEILLLYVLTRLDNVLIFSGWVVAIYVVIYFGSLIRWCESYTQEETKASKSFVDKVVSKWYIPVLALLMFVVIPSKEDAGIILAGTGVIEAAKNETTQRIAGKSVQVIEQFLDEMLKKEK